MKKFFSLTLLSLLCVSLFSAPLLTLIGQQIIFNVRGIDDTIPLPRPKSPVETPTVSIDDHTLYFYDVDSTLTLELYDEDDQLVFTTVVVANAPSVSLSSNLSGTYLLELNDGTNIYYCELEL